MRLRPESSVSVGKDEYGELVFACDGHGPVVHRTPEELGIPRVIAAPPPRAASLPRVRRKAALDETKRCGGETKGRPGETERLRTVRGVKVRMPARAVMGAEMLDEFAKEDGMVQKSGGRPCEAPGCAELAYDERRYCTKKHAWKNGGAAKKRKKEVPEPEGGAAKARAGNPRRERALMALAGRDALEVLETAGRFRVQLEMTHAELAGMVARFRPEQLAALAAHGLRAALLA